LYTPPDGATNSLQQNADGTWTETQPDGFELRYNTSGRLSRLQDIVGSRWTLSHDAGGRVTKIEDPLGLRTSVAYDGSNRIKRVEDSAARFTSYTVNGSGDLTQVTSPDLCLTEMRYDSVHRLKAWIDPVGNRTSFSYDDQTAVAVQEIPKSRASFTAADQRNIGIRLWGGCVRRQAAKREAARNNRGEISPFLALRMCCPPRNRPRNGSHGSRSARNFHTGLPKGHGKRITYSHTALGQRKVMIEPEGGRFSYVYDDATQLKYLENPQNQRTSYAYDTASRVTVQKLANGTRASYTYDDDNRLTRLANLTSTPTTLSSFDYKYDSVGNRTRVHEADGSRVTWTYDNLYGLTRGFRTGTTPYHLTHTYDSVGNRLVNIDGSARTTTTYDAANQIRRYQDSSGITTHAYDATGNLAVVTSPTSQRTTQNWDTENRITLVQLPSGTRNTMTYNGTGLRTQKQDSA
jgi:YD repeat-containing protein